MTYFVYLDVSESILLKSTDSCFKALYYIFDQIDHQTKIWESSLKNRQEIADKLDITIHAANKIVISLRERRLLVNTTKSGKYKLNPEIFES
jgi:hypothetical protein